MTRLKAVVIVFVVLTSGLAAQQLPDNPQPVADKSFWLVTSANAAATLGDIVSTSVLVGNTRTCPYEAWGSTLYGAKPSSTRTSAVMGGLFVASVGLSYELKKYNVHIWKLKLWTAPQAYLAFGHAQGTIHNLQVCH